LSGRLDLDGVMVKSSLPLVTLRGTVTAHADQIATTALTADIARVGKVTIGSPAAPAAATMLSFLPFRLGALDVPFSGSGLMIADSPSGAHPPVEIRDFHVDARLVGPPDARRLVGEVALAGGVLARRPKGERRAGAANHQHPWYQALPPGLAIDLRLRGTRKALRVPLPVLPDVTVDFDCRLRATRQGATLTGSLRGDGPYDRAMVDLYAWLNSKDLRRCQL
jgi:hypothetical protein